MTNDPWLYIHAGVGATILWAKMRKEQRKVYVLTTLTDMFIENEKLRLLTEFIIFVSLGSYVTYDCVRHPNDDLWASLCGRTRLDSRSHRP